MSSRLCTSPLLPAEPLHVDAELPHHLLNHLDALLPFSLVMLRDALLLVNGEAERAQAATLLKQHECIARVLHELRR